jgi:hypothetical protein
LDCDEDGDVRAEETEVTTRVEFDFHTAATREEVVELLTDFSSDRPKRWPALSPRWYEVYDVGTSTADVREGQDKPLMWAREEYDWSTPGTVTWTVSESSDLAPGSFVSLTATASPNGGSDVHGTWERGAKTAKAPLILVVMRLAGRRVLANYFRKVYDDLAVRRR